MSFNMSMRFAVPCIWALASFAAAGCSSPAPAQTGAPMREASVPLTSVPFGKMPDGRPIDVITFHNGHGVEVRVMTYGGIILSIRTPDRAGQIDDIVLGHDDAAGYFSNGTYFGVIVGRYANRIAKGKFTLDGKTYTLATNNGVNHLHGGKKGWDQALWAAEPFQRADGVGVVLTLTSPDGDEGYPGAVHAKVTYTLTDKNELAIDYEAKTDKATIINMTQHSYFNLAGSKAADILGHKLEINADTYTPVDDTLIPTGRLAAVAGTPFDFRTVTAIGERINQDDEQLKRGKGYDHNWVLNRTAPGLSAAAHVEEPITGRTLDVKTTEPGIQFYSGNFLDGTVAGKGGTPYGHRAGFCLETQHFPDSPNHANFPSTTLRPGETYTSHTVFTFGVTK
jgi:aldose 1-epimerase